MQQIRNRGSPQFARGGSDGSRVVGDIPNLGRLKRALPNPDHAVERFGWGQLAVEEQVSGLGRFEVLANTNGIESHQVLGVGKLAVLAARRSKQVRSDRSSRIVELPDVRQGREFVNAQFRRPARVVLLETLAKAEAK